MFCRECTLQCPTSGTAGVQLISGHTLLTTYAGLLSQDQVGLDTLKHDPHSEFAEEDMINITEF